MPGSRAEVVKEDDAVRLCLAAVLLRLPIPRNAVAEVVACTQGDTKDQGPMAQRAAGNGAGAATKSSIRHGSIASDRSARNEEFLARGPRPRRR